MGVSAPSFSLAHGTDAEFRTWVGAIRTAITGLGLIRTTDTGQIDIATVARPTVINTAMGYDIYRFADTLQATLPVFIKVEFGSGATATHPALWITVGTGTDGAGTLTGQVSTRQQIRADGVGSTQTHRFSGDTNRIVAMLTAGSWGSNHLGFGVERSKDAAGDDTADGIIVQMTNYAGNHACYQQFIPATGSIGILESGPMCPVLRRADAADTASDGTDIGVFAATVLSRKGVESPGRNFFGYFNADLAAENAVAVSVYGDSQTIFPFGNVSRFGQSCYYRTGGAPSNNAAASLAMRYN